MLTPTQKDHIVDSWWHGVPVLVLSNRYGVSKNTICEVLRLHGVVDPELLQQPYKVQVDARTGRPFNQKKYPLGRVTRVIEGE